MMNSNSIINDEEQNQETRRISVLMKELSLQTLQQDDFERIALENMQPFEEGGFVIEQVNLYCLHDYGSKPSYFNRVLTCYKMPRNSKVAYGYDNPLPRVVQGYSFNLFYPDLVNKSESPRITILKDGCSTDTCIIKFHAGKPYADIAFRIVNKEWEEEWKKGYHCTFDRGVLRLCFNFKHHRYLR